MLLNVYMYIMYLIFTLVNLGRQSSLIKEEIKSVTSYKVIKPFGAEGGLAFFKIIFFFKLPAEAVAYWPFRYWDH